jgi:purine-binding chemotaxis protein CheW
MPGYVTFRLDQQAYALRLDEVREIVRLDGLERLPGTQPPMAGMIVVRGEPLPVLDVRKLDRTTGEPAETGDVLVMGRDGDQLGMAVDEVLGVLSADDLPASAEPTPKSLPAYVVAVHRFEGKPVLLVDLPRLLEQPVVPAS